MMLSVIIGIIAAIIIIILILYIVIRSRSKCKTEEVKEINCENSTTQYGWRIRWFLISGDSLMHPFQWIIDRVPDRYKEKTTRLLDNKLKYYKRQVSFESETDLNDSINSCSRINDKLSTVIPLEHPDYFKNKMDEFDRLMVEQHRHTILEEFQLSENEFLQGCKSIDEIIQILPQAA